MVFIQFFMQVIFKLCNCLTYGHDEYDAAVAMIAGHHPRCPDFKIDKHSFTENLRAEAQKIADKMFLDELPKLRDFYAPKKVRAAALTESAVQVRLFYYLQKKGHKLIAPNIDIFSTGEMDVVSVMKSGLVNEYEIKLSRADFKKDFKKEHRHPVFEKILQGIFSETRTGYSGRIQWEVKFTAPNFFYYVTPLDMVAVEELPAYAGLICFDPKFLYDLRVVKRAVKLHNEPLGADKRADISKALMWRCWTAKSKIQELKEELARK